MSLSAPEIELGRLAIERNLLTREQVRACADMRSAGNTEHLARLLVNQGYLNTEVAKQLWTEVQRRHDPHGSAYGSQRRVAGSGYGTPGSGYGAPGSGYGAPGSGYGVSVTCPTCGAQTTASSAQAGRQVTCRGCSGSLPVPGAAAGSHFGSGFGQRDHGSGFGRPQVGPNGTHNQRANAPGAGGPYGTARIHDTRGGSNDGFSESGAQGSGGFQLVSDSAFAAAADKELPPNVGMDDPIAYAMSTRKNTDGSVEAVFGPYDIIGEIARGGMGIVYRARQRSLKRIVALKVMKEGENASEKQIRRFKRETEAAAKLQHPNIVAVHEVGCHEGFHYFTMDLIEGDPLDAIVKRKEKMPVNRVLEIVQEVAQAIHYAHGKGIIHRDLKPANILLDTDGHPKVTDFGLAKQIDHKSMLTRTGAVVGTPFYMPPEQARGDVDIDQRADVYALGVILYELLTLKLPFHGETTMEVYHKILEEEPLPPRKHDSRLDMDANTIVLKAMEKELSRRYQTALDLAEDIERYLQGDPIKARPLGPIGRSIKKAKKNMPVVIVASITVFALLGSLGFIYWRHQRALARAYKINQDHEWDTFQTEVDNQCANARSQITSGVARQRDRDPEGALADLEEAERILQDLSLLAEDFTKWNGEERTEAFLEEKQPDINGIYQSIYLEMGKAHALKNTEGSLKTALEFFGRGLERQPSTPDSSKSLHLEIGRVQAKQGRFDKALATFAEILEKAPGDVSGRLEMGRVHDMAGDHLKAIESYTQVIDAEAKSVRAYLLRGQSHYTLGRFNAALADFAKVLDLQDDLFEGYVWRGRTQQALGHFGEAQEDLTEAIDITPSLPDGYYYRAELHFAQRKHAQAIKDYEVAISRSAQFYRAYLGLGRALEWILDYDRARQHYSEILSADEREAALVAPQARAALATLDLIRSDLFECRMEEEDRLRQAGADDAGTPGELPPLDELLAKAKDLRERRLASAEQGFEEALKGDPELVVALLGRARLALVQGDRDVAQAKLERALEVLGNRPSVRLAAPEEWEGEEDEWEEEDDWEDDDAEAGGAAEVGVDFVLAETHALLGRVALLAGELDKAEAAFKAALKANPRCAAAKAGEGHLAVARDDPASAAELFAAARALQEQPSGDSGYFYSEGLRFQGLAQRSKKPEYFMQSRQAFARASAGNAFYALALLERAKLSAEWANYDVGVELAGKAIESDPFLREAYELRGFLFARDLPVEPDAKTKRPKNLRDYGRGKAEFDEAIRVAEKPSLAADAYYGRALALLAQAEAKGEGQGEELVRRAETDLEEAIKSIPADFREAEPRQINQSIRYLELYAKVNERLGDEQGSAEALARVNDVRAQARKAAEQELEEGRSLRDRLNYSEAIKHFDRAIELHEGYSEAFYDRGTCYLKIGNFVPGILDFSRALELDPRIADQVYNKVYQISYVVDLNRVITELNKIVSDHPNVSYVVFLRGFFYVAKTEFKQVGRKDLELGIADFDRCLELNPEHVTAYLYRGFMWFKMAGRETTREAKERLYAKALADHKRALELDKESGISHYLQALSWSVMSADEWLTKEQSEEYKQHSIRELAASFKFAFKGFERIRNEKGFDHVRDMPEFKELMRGK